MSFAEPDTAAGAWIVRVPMLPGHDDFLLEAEMVLHQTVAERQPSPGRNALLRLLDGCQNGYREEPPKPLPRSRAEVGRRRSSS